MRDLNRLPHQRHIRMANEWKDASHTRHWGDPNQTCSVRAYSMAKIRILMAASWWEREAPGRYTADEAENPPVCSCMANRLNCLYKVHMYLPQGPVILFLGVQSREMRTYVHTKPVHECSQQLFSWSPNSGNKPQSSPAGAWRKQVWFGHAWTLLSRRSQHTSWMRLHTFCQVREARLRGSMLCESLSVTLSERRHCWDRGDQYLLWPGGRAEYEEAHGILGGWWTALHSNGGNGCKPVCACQTLES